MSETWVPSLREYAAWYQINGRRLAPAPGADAPRPGQPRRRALRRGRRLARRRVITAQVEAGVVVRMAVLYELLGGAPGAAGAAPRPAPQPEREPRRRRAAGVSAAEPLSSGPQARPPSCCCATCTCSTRARASTRRLDVRVRGGRIAELADAGHARRRGRARRSIDGGGRLRLLPAFFDPHVHLRTPGQEHKEDLDTGTRAAAAGGFGGVIAMPNTDPVLDSAPLLRSLRDAAAREARVPVGFLAAITRGLRGRAADRDGRAAPGGRARLHRRRRAGARARGCCARRCSTSACAAACSRCTRRTRRCRAGGAMHEGAVSAALGLGGIPTRERVDDGRPRRRARRLRGRARALPAPQLRRLGRGGRRRQGARAGRVSAEVTPHHLLLTDEDVRGHGHAHEDAPAAGHRGRTAWRSIEGAARRHDRLRRHRPRAARARGEGGALRAGADGHDRPGDGLRRALHRARAAGRARAGGCSSSG